MCNCFTSKYSSVPEALMSSMMGILISLAVSPDLNKITPSPPSKSFPWKADLSIVLYLPCKNQVKCPLSEESLLMRVPCSNHHQERTFVVFSKSLHPPKNKMFKP